LKLTQSGHWPLCGSEQFELTAALRIAENTLDLWLIECPLAGLKIKLQQFC